MKFGKTLNIKNAIIVVVTASVVKLIFFGLVVLGMKVLHPSFPVYGFSSFQLFSSLIIDFVTIIFAIRFFKVEVKGQFNKISLVTIFLFAVLAILIFLLILPLVNPVDFFEKLLKQRITVRQHDFGIFDKPWFFNIFYFFLMVIITPITEEILYRGIILNLFLKKYSEITSLILSSLIFAFIHLKFTGFGYLFLYGLLFGFAYCKTKSLYAPIFLHFLINLLAMTTSYRYIELNNTNSPKFFLFAIVLLAAVFIVSNSLNKGINSLKSATKTVTGKNKMTFPKFKEK